MVVLHNRFILPLSVGEACRSSENFIKRRYYWL